MSECIQAVTQPGNLFADVNGEHARVVAFAIVHLEETIDGVPEGWDVVQGVVSGPASELGLVDLADCHPGDECQARGCRLNRPDFRGTEPTVLPLVGNQPEVARNRAEPSHNGASNRTVASHLAPNRAMASRRSRAA